MSLKYPQPKRSEHYKGGNIRFVETKPTKNYVAYDVVHVPKKGWKATPYTLNAETQEYVSDNTGAITGKSRGEAVEKLFVKTFSMREGEIDHRRMVCIDHLVKANA